MFHAHRPLLSVSISSGGHWPLVAIVGGLRPLLATFDHVLPPPSPEKSATARPWVMSLKGSIDQGLSSVQCGISAALTAFLVALGVARAGEV
jgi:hypothetical protein